ncbi:MAG: class I tRNA ligase family protein, partial [Spirochaetia bacterium]|nr:class I tRNA ligase family protein [Spirochaetia bacterium]
MSKTRRILVTSALPYANGPIHLGHLVEYIQTDIWVRYQRFMGHQAWYFCADDTHGTPVMLAAKKEGITPEELVRRTHTEHLRDLSAFQVAFDNYYTTHSDENRWFAEDIYNKALKNKHIQRKSIQQLYCPKESMFLPDRFVKGECPKCGAKDQYGDSCEVCGSTYQPKDLKKPYCASCSAEPVEKESEHLFFRLSDFKDFLKKWIETPGRVDPAVLNKMQEWLGGELRDWDISRDA